MKHLIYPTRPAGFIISNDLEIPTLQCAHCGKHWEYKIGEHIYRGICLKCMKPTCGSKKCCKCKPYVKHARDLK